MAYSGRDPLSVRYDGAAARYVSRAIAANGAWVETTVAPPSQKIVAWAMARGIDPFRIRYTGQASGIENQHEAAFRRACYWDSRIYLWARPSRTDEDGMRVRNPDRVAALEFKWGRRTTVGRLAKVRVHSIEHGSQWGAKFDPYGRQR